MSIKKYDDETGEEMPIAAGLEVTALLEDGTVRVQHFATWAHIPKRLLDGQIGGKNVARIQLRNLEVEAVTTRKSARVNPS